MWLIPSLLLFLPIASQEAVPVEPATAPPASVEKPTPAEAIQTGVQLLLQNQERYRKDPPVPPMPDEELPGWQAKERERMQAVREKSQAHRKGAEEWPYEGVYRVGFGVIPSGYRVGGTSIVSLALVHAPGYAEDEARQAAVERSVGFVLQRLEKDRSLAGQAQEGYDVRGWGQTYALELFLTVIEHKAVTEELAERCSAAIPDLIERIQKGSLPGGGWNYAGRGCSPFMTAPTLLTLYRAVAAGYEVPEALIVSALEALEAGRNEETGSFAYAGRGKSVMPASAARSAVAELALLQAGRSDAARMRVAVEGFFDNWEHLLVRKSQQGTHKPPYAIAPYYFYFGHTYAALAIESLAPEQRPELRARLQDLLWQTREPHGGWNDRIFPRTESYSTAMSLLALMAPDLPSPAEWRPQEAAVEAEAKAPAAPQGGE